MTLNLNSKVTLLFVQKMCSHWMIIYLFPGSIPDWWVWANWVSPLTYAYHALVVNEMYAPRWMHPNVSKYQHKLLINKKNLNIFLSL